MENLIISLNVVFPLCILLVIGYLIKKVKLIDTHTQNGMNKVAFKAFFPVLLFNSIYKTDVSAFNPKLLIYAVAVIFLIFVMLCVIVPIIEKSPRRRGVLIQGMFRSNFVIFGLPISIALCGAESAGATSILVAVIVPLYNALSVVALAIHKGGKLRLATVLKGVITNPLIIGGVAGIIALLLNVRFPTPVESVISDIAKLTTPLALILLGSSFEFSQIKGNVKPVLLGVLGKLVVVPIIFILLSIFMGFRGVELVALTVMLGAPAAVSSYTMASEMEGDSILAGQLVVFGSITAIVTMFIWIFSMKQLGLF